MSADVEIHLEAMDDASSVVETMGSNLTGAFQKVETDAKTLATTTQTETGKMSASFTDGATAFNKVASSGLNLFNSISRVEDSQVALDRANVVVEKSTLAVHDAQNKYNDAVAKFGADSPQAKDALDKLNVAQDSLRVAHERADVAQRNFTGSMLNAAVSVIPQVITIIGGLGTVMTTSTGLTEGLGAAMDFLALNPVVAVMIGIGLLIGALIIAYEKCGPFKAAIDLIAGVLGGALKTAVEDIQKGLQWLWDNILEPLGTFLIATLLKDWQDLSSGLDWAYKNVLKPVFDAIEWFYNNVIKPFADAIGGVVNAVSGAAKSVGGAMNGVASSVAGGLGAAGSAISGFIGSICFAHALERAADSSAKTMSSWNEMIRGSMDKGLGEIKDFNAEIGVAGMAGGSSIALGSAPLQGLAPTARAPVINISGPLVHIEGSADKATVDLAAKQVLQQFKTVIVEPTSYGASSTQKRIRKGSLMIS